MVKELQTAKNGVKLYIALKKVVLGQLLLAFWTKWQASTWYINVAAILESKHHVLIV